MSEEKLYAVKDDEGKYWDFSDGSGFWILDIPDSPTTTSKEEAELVADNHGGHVVMLVEEPKKVVLSKEQAEIVEKAKMNRFPASYVAQHTGYSGCLEKQLMNAYVNGYTVANEKKYNVKVPKKWSGDDKHYWTKEQDGTLTWAHLINNDYMTPYQQFTITEIERYGLQDCEKEEVSDDGE